MCNTFIAGFCPTLISSSPPVAGNSVSWQDSPSQFPGQSPTAIRTLSTGSVTSQLWDSGAWQLPSMFTSFRRENILSLVLVEF